MKIGTADLSGDPYPGVDKKGNLNICFFFADGLHLPGQQQILLVRQIPFTKDQRMGMERYDFFDLCQEITAAQAAVSDSNQIFIGMHGRLPFRGGGLRTVLLFLSPSLPKFAL